MLIACFQILQNLYHFLEVKEASTIFIGYDSSKNRVIYKIFLLFAHQLFSAVLFLALDIEWASA